MKKLISVLILVFSFNLSANIVSYTDSEPLSHKEVQALSSGLYDFFENNNLKLYEDNKITESNCRLFLDLNTSSGTFSILYRLENRIHKGQHWAPLTSNLELNEVIERNYTPKENTVFVIKGFEEIKNPDFKGQNNLEEIFVKLSADETSVVSLNFVTSILKRVNKGTVRTPDYKMTYQKTSEVLCK